MARAGCHATSNYIKPVIVMKMISIAGQPIVNSTINGINTNKKKDFRFIEYKHSCGDGLR